MVDGYKKQGLIQSHRPIRQNDVWNGPDLACAIHSLSNPQPKMNGFGKSIVITLKGERC